MSFPFDPVPWAMATANGDPVKTDKRADAFLGKSFTQLNALLKAPQSTSFMAIFGEFAESCLHSSLWYSM